MGATAEGKKELITVVDGYRESEQSWRQLLLDCRQRGLEIEPKLAAGEQAFDEFIEMLAAKYPAAVECLTRDRDALLTFYDFPAEHWIHIRTTNPIESTFATVKHRQRTG